jgi:hypothetical protein
MAAQVAAAEHHLLSIWVAELLLLDKVLMVAAMVRKTLRHIQLAAVVEVRQ